MQPNPTTAAADRPTDRTAAASVMGEKTGAGGRSGGQPSRGERGREEEEEDGGAWLVGMAAALPASNSRGGRTEGRMGFGL